MISGEHLGFRSKSGSLILNLEPSKGEAPSMMQTLSELEGKIDKYSAKTKELLMKYSLKGNKKFIFEGEDAEINERIRELHEGLDKAGERSAEALKLVEEWKEKDKK